MTTRPASRILEILADECADLASVAQTLDRLIPSVIQQLPDRVGPDARDLQRVDALHQHLMDTSRALGTLAVLVELEPDLDVAALIDGVRLDYFKNLLLDQPVAPDAGPGQGEAQLF